MDAGIALILLAIHGWTNAPRTPEMAEEYVFLSPEGKQYICKDDNEVIDLVKAQGLESRPITNKANPSEGHRVDMRIYREGEDDLPIREILLKNKPLDGTSAYRINEGLFRVIGKEGAN